MITPLGAAQAIKYLHAAGTMTAVDDQEAVWADYLNDPQTGAPQADDTDLLPAARHRVREWNRQDGGYRRNVNVDDFARSLRTAHERKITERCGVTRQDAGTWQSVPVFVGDGTRSWPGPADPWISACRQIAETETDRLTIWKQATRRVLSEYAVSLDETATQPEWVQRAYQIEPPAPYVPGQAGSAL